MTNMYYYIKFEVSYHFRHKLIVFDKVVILIHSSSNCCCFYKLIFFVKVVAEFRISKVIDSDNLKFKLGDIYSFMLHLASQNREVQLDDIPISYHIGLLSLCITPFFIILLYFEVV